MIMLKISLEYKKSMMFVRLKGNLNSNTSSYFEEYTLPIINDFKVKYLVINLNNLDTVDNIGYQSIDNVSQVVKNKNGKVLIIDRYNHFFNPDLLALNIIKI